MLRRTVKTALAACLMLSLLFATGLVFAAGNTLAKVGTTGEVVHVIHERLYRLQYLPKMPAKDLYTKTTKAAVTTFQKANSLTANGLVDDVTYTRLVAAYAVSYPDYVDTLRDKQNKLGGKGAYVGETQTRLKKLGYYTGAINRRYTPATQSAVTYFQLVHRLSQSGEADLRTRTVLFSDNATTRVAYETANHIIGLKKSDKGAEVTYLQNQLQRYGYLASVTGTYNADTIVAVRMFQEANSLTASGAANRETRQKINSGNVVTFATYAAALKTRTLSRGDSGSAVRILQLRLRELYYYAGSINGKFDTGTFKAVRNFQNYSMTETFSASNRGRVGVKTLAALYQNANIKNRIDAYGFIVGDTGDDVRDYQQDLYDLGYLSYCSGKVNGTIGARTITATKLFQKANGLTVSGVPTPATREKAASSSAISLDDYKNGATASAKVQKLIAVAYNQLGKPYRSNCSVPASFDCSRYTKYVYGKVGVSLSGEVSAQYKAAAKKYTKISSASDLKLGDLVYFDTQTNKSPGHAAIWLGKVGGKYCFIHASSSAGKVLVTEYSSWYKERFVGGVRVFK